MKSLPHKGKKTQLGFTLIELMVVVALIAVAATVAVPSVKTMVYNNYRRVEVNDMLVSLRFARAQAVGLRTDITVCKSNTGSSCDNSLGYEAGWIVFEDGGTMGTVETGETILRYWQTLKGTGVTLRGNNNVRNRVTFSKYGFASGSVGTLVWCDDRGFGVDARALVITLQGRVRVTDGTDSSLTVSSCTP